MPDDTNVARLQEELIAVKLREAEALTGLKELRQQVRDLEDHWQVGTKRRSDPSRPLLALLLKPDRPCLPFPAAPLGADRRPMERQPEEEHAERAAGRADEREAARSRGPGGTERE